MCRTTDYHGLQLSTTNQEKDHLKIKSFYVRFIGFQPRKPVPDSLTLLYRNGTRDDLVIDGSKVRPDSKAFLGLHRIVNVEEKKEGEFIFGSRERVLVSEGVRFEIYSRDERVLEGVFRKGADVEKWTLECGGCCGDVAAVEVCVAVDGQVALSERVEMKRRKKSWRGCERLEVIPEEADGREDESVGTCCCDCDGTGMDGGDWEDGCGPDCGAVEMDLEGVRWAIDVGIWVMCLGVGYMVSKASAKSLRRLRFF